MKKKLMIFDTWSLWCGGVVFLLLSLYIFSSTNSWKNRLNDIQSRPVLNRQMLDTLEKEDEVLIFGTITEASPTHVYKGLTMGIREYDPAGDDDWQETHNAAAALKIKIDTQTVVDVTYEDSEPNGNYETLSSGHDSRYRGYAAETPLTTMAMVTSLKPLVFTATDHYGGSINAYEDAFNSYHTLTWWVSMLFLGSCFVIAFNNSLSEEIDHDVLPAPVAIFIMTMGLLNPLSALIAFVIISIKIANF